MTWRNANLWKLAIIRCFFWMQFFSAIIVAYFTTVIHLTLSEVLFLNAWFMLASFVIAVFTGALADFFGRRISVALACLVSTGGVIGYITAPSFAVLLGVEIVFAFAYTFLNADEALAIDSLPDEVRGVASSRALSFLEAAKLIGILVGALSGGFIAQRWGLRAPLIAYCAPIAIAFLVALTLRERRGGTSDGTPAATQPSRYLALIRTGFRIFRADSTLQLIAFEAALTNALVWTLIWLYQPVLQRSGIPVAWFGIVQTTASVAQIAILTNIARVERLFGTLRRFVVVATFIAAAALIAVGMTQRHFVVIAGIIVAITFGLCRVPLYAAEMNARIPSAQRATALSVTSMVRTLAIAAVNPLVGYFADRSLSTTLLSLGIALFITATLFIAARGRTTSPAT